MLNQILVCFRVAVKVEEKAVAKEATRLFSMADPSFTPPRNPPLFTFLLLPEW